MRSELEEFADMLASERVPDWMLAGKDRLARLIRGRGFVAACGIGADGAARSLLQAGCELPSDLDWSRVETNDVSVALGVLADAAYSDSHAVSGFAAEVAGWLIAARAQDASGSVERACGQLSVAIRDEDLGEAIGQLVTWARNGELAEHAEAVIGGLLDGREDYNQRISSRAYW